MTKEEFTAYRSEKLSLIKSLNEDRINLDLQIGSVKRELRNMTHSYAEFLSPIKKGDKAIWITSKRIRKVWEVGTRVTVEVPCIVEFVTVGGVNSDRLEYKLRLLKKDGTPSERFANSGFTVDALEIKQAEQ
jgi:hypothetical protein